MVITNTGYQLSQDKPYDPYSLLQSELSTVLTRNKTLGQQIGINIGINTLATTNPDDYGWNALGAVTGTLAGKVGSYTKGIPIIQNLNPIISGGVSEYYGDSTKLKEWHKQAEEKYAK